MTDIGDAKSIDTLVTVEGVPVDPATIVLTVTDPDGIETTPNVFNLDVGQYRSTFTVDKAGRWIYEWQTTDPDGVDWGPLDVRADPPPRLLPLATCEDLEQRVGTLNDAQKDRADALLLDASALIRAETKMDITAVDNDVAVLRSAGMVITLPNRPVRDVTKVVAVGVPPVRDLVMPVGTWVWDRLDKVEINPGQSGIINLPEVWSTEDWPGAGSYRVTYSHGSETTPQVLIGLTCGMVNRCLTAPAISELVSQSIGSGDYAWQANQATGAMGVGVRLTQTDRNMLKRWGYLRTTATSETVVR